MILGCCSPNPGSPDPGRSTAAVKTEAQSITSMYEIESKVTYTCAQGYLLQSVKTLRRQCYSDWHYSAAAFRDNAPLDSHPPA